VHCSTSSPFSNGPMLSSKSIRDSSGDFAAQGIQSRMMFMGFAPMRIGKLEGWFIYQYMLVEAPRLKSTHPVRAALRS
jgi:hypothetical protein